MTPIDAVLVAFRSQDVIESAVQMALTLGGAVVVVDHGDGASARRAAHAGATVVEDPTNPGFGAGQNRGVARSSTAYVLLCNPDADIVPQAVTSGAALLDARPDVAAIQGVIVNRATGEPERSAGVELGPLHLLGRALGLRGLLRFRGVQAMARCVPSLRDHAERVPTGPVEVESLAATAVLVRRSAFDSVGGFDESYFLYGEDLDLCRRLRLAGWNLMAVPEVWATHANGGSAESSWDREVFWWQGTMGFAARWWGGPGWWAGIASSTVAWVRLSVSRPAGAGGALSAMVRHPASARSPQIPAPKTSRSRAVSDSNKAVGCPYSRRSLSL